MHSLNDTHFWLCSSLFIVPVAKTDLKLSVNQQFIAPSLYNQMTQLVFLTDTFRPRIKCTTPFFFAARFVCARSVVFCQNFDRSCSGCQTIRLGVGDDFRGPSGQALPLPSRVSLSRTRSFLCPLLPSACYAGYAYGLSCSKQWNGGHVGETEKNSVEIELFSQVKISLFFQELCIPADHVSKKQSLSLRIQTPCACVLLTLWIRSSLNYTSCGIDDFSVFLHWLIVDEWISKFYKRL